MVVPLLFAYDSDVHLVRDLDIKIRMLIIQSGLFVTCVSDSDGFNNFNINCCLDSFFGNY